MDAAPELFKMKATAEAAAQLARLEGYAFPLSERQREMVALLLAAAFIEGMKAGLMEVRV